MSDSNQDNVIVPDDQPELANVDTNDTTLVQNDDQPELIDVDANDTNLVQNDEDEFVAPSFVYFNIVVKVGDLDVEIKVNSEDSANEINTALLENKETCHITSYHLEFNDQILTEYDDLSDIEGFGDGAVVVLVEDDYNTRSAKKHVDHLQKLMKLITDMNTMFYNIANEETYVNGFKSVDFSFLLSHVYPQVTKLPKCVQKMYFSEWNPPPSNRVLIGDLLYIEVTTLEGENLGITCSSKGFYVNNTTVDIFDPKPRDDADQAHTLVGLLSSVSPSFAQNWTSNADIIFNKNVFQLQEDYPGINSWIKKEATHSFSEERANWDIVYASDIDLNVNNETYDWNEYIQKSFDNVIEDIPTKIQNDIIIARDYNQFLDTAIVGAMLVANDEIPAVDDSLPKQQQQYVYNNILFYFSADNKKSANSLSGILSINKSNIQGLHTVPTAIIDYRGFRVVAEAIVQGLYNEPEQLYGKSENGFKNEEEVHELLEMAGTSLSVQSHKIEFEGDEHQLNFSSDAKIFKGADGRKYITDLYQTLPRDINYPDDTSAVFRVELLRNYILSEAKEDETEEQHFTIPNIKFNPDEYTTTNVVYDESDFEESEEDNAQQEETEGDAQQEEIEGDDQQEPAGADAQEETTEDGAQEEPVEALVEANNEEPSEPLSKDQKLLHNLAKLVKTEIGQLCLHFKFIGVSIIDGDNLVELLHSRGINLRYMGYIADIFLSQNNEVIEHLPLLCIAEMIARSFKKLYFQMLAQKENHQVGEFTAAFLSAYFNHNSSSKSGSLSGVSDTYLGKKNNDTIDKVLNHRSLWTELRRIIAQKFKFVLPDRIPLSFFDYPMLRLLCKRSGIQIYAKNYRLRRNPAFTSRDILQLNPIVKKSKPFSQEAVELLATGRSYLSRKEDEEAIKFGEEIVRESLNIGIQVYGIMHEHVAECYNSIATVQFFKKDYENAITNQEFSLIIYERIFGVDHYQVAQAYRELAVMDYTHNGSTQRNRNLIKRSLYLQFLLAGPSAPEFDDYLLTTANIHSEVVEGIYYLEKLLESQIQQYGEDNVRLSTIYHMLATTCTTNNTHIEALRYEQKNYEILKNNLGKDHENTLQSQSLLSDLMKAAMAEIKELKKSGNEEKIAVSEVKPKKKRRRRKKN
eukprot:TRINITY_DN519_c0_g1_i2.p1 TRINITY_DN519_c0_g1~~TRINITY_DN519_c0_g1_i2.p1  ORF type:complete len:1141 (-),score=341.31 TRINITY_DN519_c0_g1_i2:1213-4635(-)